MGTCAQCKWFKSATPANAVKVDSGGNCHANPPTYIFVPNPAPKIARPGQNEMMQMAIWPVVPESNTCRLFTVEETIQ